MQIEADKEGADLIRQLCDVALKSGGLANLAGITQILACLYHPDKPKIPVPGSKIPVPDKVNPKRPKRGKLKRN